MKFSLAIVALAAAVAQAQPTSIAEPALFSEANSLQKRSDATFTVYTSTDCSGTGTVITTTGSTVKGNFNPPQHSIKINSLNSAFHISLYPLPNQGGGTNLRLNSGNVGQCWFWTGNWQSYGVYDH